MVSKMVVVTFVIAIIRIVILLPLSQSFPLFICHCQDHIFTFVTVFSPYLTFNIVLGMPPVPHTVQVAELKALHLSKVDLRQ